VRQLLAFGGLAHDPQRILATVYRLALVSVKLGENISVRGGKAGLELRVAPFAHTDSRGRRLFYDPQASVRHDRSLAHLAGGT
jgi:hypothetical protein